MPPSPSNGFRPRPSTTAPRAGAKSRGCRATGSYVTNRRELEFQAVQQINQAFSSLLSDVRLVYDDKTKKLTYRSMLVTQSRHPNAWATAVGIQMDSSSPLPKLRFEYRAPNPLIGTLPMHAYRGIGVAIVIELTPKPDAPVAEKSTPALRKVPTAPTKSAPQSATNWAKVAGGGLVVLGAAIVVGTIVEDFFTVGFGALDDPASFALGSGCVAGGLAMIHGNASSLPSASIPARVDMKVALTIAGAPENGKPRL